MRKLVLIAMAAGSLALAGCQTDRQDRQLSGALIGGGAGALIGGLATGSGTGALIGAGVGALAGTVIADATRPGYCRYYTRSGSYRTRRC